ncbi:G-protein coupled receptor Mth-like [Drosophila kikkawai]|uniref:G-protein coupled receptor Mth-like n=1 Tax=Drosophila kikkawai TaxID=30033 RepID=A0ABM3C4E4_DROKI
MYQDIEIPEYLTGQYDYITTEEGIREGVRNHLRGCICQLKPCIWICCRFKDWDEPNSKCTDGMMEELAGIDPFLNVTLINGSVAETNLLKDFIVLRDRLRLSDIWVKEKYTIFENGSVLLNSTDILFFRGYDCLHPNQFTSGNTESFVAAFHMEWYNERYLSLNPGMKELLCLSEVSLGLTIVLYLHLKKLRNLHGKCFICYMIASFMYFVFYLLEAVPIHLQLCVLQGYVTIYFFIAKLSWLLALSHQLWRGFTSVNRVESEYSFGAYSTFAWGSTAILTGVIFLINQIWDSDPNKLDWVSGIGWENCVYMGAGNYFNYIIETPLVILVALNTILIMLTIITIIRVKLSLRHLFDQDERARNLNSRMQSFRMFASLFIVMDIQWSFRMTSIFADWNYLLTICKYCDSCIGIIIFIMFVLKRSTLNLLKESILERRK